MKPSELQILKEEIPLGKGSFVIPIHPLLLDDSIKLPEDLANTIFPKAVKAWYKDVEIEVAKGDAFFLDEVRRYGLQTKPRIKKINKTSGAEQHLGRTGWFDDVTIRENGFATGLQLERSYAGYLHVDKDPERIGKTFFGRVNMPKEKLHAFRCADYDLEKDRCMAQVYKTGNVYTTISAMLLREWGIQYLNACMKLL